MLPRLADRAPECSHTTPISPGLLRFLNFLLRRPHAAGTSPKAGHGAHVSRPWPANHISAGPPTDGVNISDGSPSNLAADYPSPSPPVLHGVTTKSIWRPPQREHVSRSAFGENGFSCRALYDTSNFLAALIKNRRRQTFISQEERCPGERV